MDPKPLRLPIYMDHNATTPLDPRVRQAMEPYFCECFGNAASNTHAYGWQAQTAMAKARTQVAELFHCETRHVVWTSGATESNNLAILGFIRAMLPAKTHIITQATEHKAVLEVVDATREWGCEVTILPVDENGRVRLAELTAAIRPETALISIMAANNEIGTLQPLAEIGQICRARKIAFHTDAAQGAGKVSLDLSQLDIDMVSVSGHKLYGPKGVGALILRPVNREFQLKPLLYGGNQEHKLRPGTSNVTGVVGLGEACAIAKVEMAQESARLSEFQRRLIDTVKSDFPAVKLNGPLEERLCNNISFSLPGISPDRMALDLSGIAYSSGSACNSADPSLSHVLKAIGLSDELARATLRLGLGRFTRKDEVQAVTDKLLKLLAQRQAL